MKTYEQSLAIWALRELERIYPLGRQRIGHKEDRDPETACEPWVEIVDPDHGPLLTFEQEERYQYSEYTGGGGTTSITLMVPLVDANAMHVVLANEAKDIDALIERLTREILAISQED